MNAYIVEESKIKLESNIRSARAPFIAYLLVVYMFIAICVLAHFVFGIYAIVADVLFFVFAVLLYGPIDYAVLTFYSRLYNFKEVTGTEFAEGYKNRVRTRASFSFAVKKLVVGLSGILLIFPAILLSVSFSMSSILLRKNPNLGYLSACRASSKLMKGYKRAYFGLMARLAPMFLLGALTLGIGFIFVLPHMYMRHIVFYSRVIKGDTKHLPSDYADASQHSSSEPNTFDNSAYVMAQPKPATKPKQKPEARSVPLESVTVPEPSISLEVPTDPVKVNEEKEPEFEQGYSNITHSSYISDQNSNFGDPLIVKAKPMFDEKTHPTLMRYDEFDKSPEQLALEARLADMIDYSEDSEEEGNSQVDITISDSNQDADAFAENISANNSLGNENNIGNSQQEARQSEPLRPHHIRDLSGESLAQILQKRADSQPIVPEPFVGSKKTDSSSNAEEDIIPSDEELAELFGEDFLDNSSATEPEQFEEPAVEPVIVEPVKAEPVKAEPVKPEPVKPEPIKVEPVRPEPVRVEPVKVEPIKVEPVRPEPVRPEPIKVEPVRPEPVRVEPVRVEPVKVEPVKVARTPRPEPFRPVRQEANEPTKQEPRIPRESATAGDAEAIRRAREERIAKLRSKR